MIKRILTTAFLAVCLALTVHATDCTVTQGTSATTAVTANCDVGLITTFSESTAAAATTTFTVNNTGVNANSVIIPTIVSYAGTYATNGFPVVTVNNIVAGTSFDIKVSNVHASNALSGALKIGFVLK